MTCDERQRYWNELLDSRDGGSWSTEPEWDAHVEVCERCRSVSAAYETLRLAIEAWPNPTPPSPASLARLARLRVPDARGRRSPRGVRSLRFAVPLAFAAALVAIGWLGSAPGWFEIQVATARSIEATARPWATSLLVAKRASIELAREAAAPAARIGRAVLTLEGPDVADQRRPRPTSMARAAADRASDARARETLNSIPDSARYAFGFLLDSDLEGPGESTGGL